ncbi:hypothetical protein [Robiginitalea sediminis]|uniref:hypothetical protein n=1 Tax=Robiginitalea sediminis TaxID=1982593 RepID=UPI000B4B9735|nr:hypothetical protein [Robiginitalea sediminis]
MRRVIIDFKKLTPELAGALLDAYPQGYGDEDIISFKNASGQWIEAVELRAEDTLYLVKIGKNLNYLMAHFEGMDADSETEREPMQSLEKEYDGSLEMELDPDF